MKKSANKKTAARKTVFRKKPVSKKSVAAAAPDYDSVLSGVVELLQEARRASARTVNAIMTATYWEVGRRIVEGEQGGKERAEYGEELIQRLSADLTARFGRGFGLSNLKQMRKFFAVFADVGKSQTVSGFLVADEPDEKSQTPSGQFVTTKYATRSRNFAILPGQILQTPSGKLERPIRQSPIGELSAGKQESSSASLLDTLRTLSQRFPLPWSHYVRLLSVKNPLAREFYEIEALRGGWTVKQLNRQIGTQFYERTALSRNKAAMLTKGQQPKPVSREAKVPHACGLQVQMSTTYHTSLLPRDRGRRWPTGRMRTLSRMAACEKSPLTLTLSPKSFAAAGVFHVRARLQTT